ncbi:hypothetical protein PFISCL1PPCAC_28213, partial [Pristionchus fissidentatus]
ECLSISQTRRFQLKRTNSFSLDHQGTSTNLAHIFIVSGSFTFPLILPPSSLTEYLITQMSPTARSHATSKSIVSLILEQFLFSFSFSFKFSPMFPFFFNLSMNF